MLRDDVAAGRKPAAIVAAVGATACTAFDPVAEIVALGREFGCFVHVDAAMAGTAMLVPELRHLWHGVEGADAISWNPHKWMGTSFDCSLFYVRDHVELNSIMSTNPSYLASVYDGAVTQYRDWGIPLGRRFRSLKLWFQLMLDGVESIQDRVRRDMANAQWLAAQVDAAPEWVRLAPTRLQTVCIRHEPAGVVGDDLERHTRGWAAALNATGRCYVTPSLLDGQWMVRVSIGAEATTFDHVRDAWNLIQHTAEAAAL
jgi:aromatic-L-amino-acid/L-tryptophan decarboxylase